MFSNSAIPPDTIKAYLETEYHAFGESPFTLRIGQTSNELRLAHLRHKVNCSAFLTAANPFSQLMGEAANATRQEALATELADQHYTFLNGIGQHPSRQWPGENSFLIFGLRLEDAKTLGKRFEQNGIIWSGEDALPQLVLLR